MIEWARAHFACDALWLAGFSFGAATALQAAARGARPQRLVTIAPPVGRIITDPIARPDCPWLIVQGDQDELIDCAAVRQWAGTSRRRRNCWSSQALSTSSTASSVELREGILGFLRR